MDFTLDLELLSNKHKLKKNKDNYNIKEKKTLIELLNDILDHEPLILNKKQMVINLKQCIKDLNNDTSSNLQNFLITSINVIQYLKKQELISSIINQNQTKVLNNLTKKTCIVNKTKLINIPKSKEKDLPDNEVSISKLNL